MKAWVLIVAIILFGILNSYAKSPERTLKNLQNAYQAEANAAHEYELYAQKAAEEGYNEAYKVFCAVSESENIHMENHKQAIKKLGGKPEKIIYKDVKVKSTKKNLKDPIKEEEKENENIYPKYIDVAQQEKATIAQKSFENAMDAEAQHEDLLNDALNNLEKKKSEDYYVSNKTGSIMTVPHKAPAPKARKGEIFIKVE